VPSRRSLLAASGTAVATAVAGCSVLADASGSPANVREHRDLRPEAGSVVARATAAATGCPRGHVTLRATAYERSGDDLQVLTAIDVRPGARACESDWRHGGIDVTHDWAELAPESEAFVSDTTSNVVYTDDTDPEVRLGKTGSSEAGEWQVRRATDDGGIPEQYRFHSTYVGATGLADGDDLATVTVDVPFSTGGLLGKSETVARSRTLTYGDTDEA
jgi:hypothetical protein